MKKSGGKTAAPGTVTQGQVNKTMSPVFGGKRGSKRTAKRGGKR